MRTPARCLLLPGATFRAIDYAMYACKTLVYWSLWSWCRGSFRLKPGRRFGRPPRFLVSSTPLTSKVTKCLSPSDYQIVKHPTQCPATPYATDRCSPSSPSSHLSSVSASSSAPPPLPTRGTPPSTNRPSTRPTTSSDPSGRSSTSPSPSPAGERGSAVLPDPHSESGSPPSS